MLFLYHLPSILHGVLWILVHSGPFFMVYAFIFPMAIVKTIVFLMLGGYHNFMIPARFGFHKVIYKNSSSPQKTFLKILHWTRVSTF